jgi:tetraacyldisaccharide-1-P 4'-kinase
MKLGWIALFTLLFAGAIPLVTNARRAEVFAACAAYAAVLVVFVSGNIGAGGTGAGGNGGYKEPQGRGIG